LTSGATAVSVELIAVSVLDEAVVDVVSAVVPESFAVQATPNVTRSMGTSNRICAL
jgi:Fe-S cluster assembly iron-binding protein IscA